MQFFSSQQRFCAADELAIVSSHVLTLQPPDLSVGLFAISKIEVTKRLKGSHFVTIKENLVTAQ